MPKGRLVKISPLCNIILAGFFTICSHYNIDEPARCLIIKDKAEQVIKQQRPVVNDLNVNERKVLQYFIWDMLNPINSTESINVRPVRK